ncbi:MAG: GIY-YIG nuclease family protein [Chloroflexi bacterium]|nr:GIY-YIG nuclease family protein [Chloroflexota bacterium]
MRQLGKLFPPPPTHPAHTALSAVVKRTAEQDLSARLWWQKLAKRGPSFMLSRLEGGSGFPVSNLFREYFRDYGNRMIEHGPHSFPTSFNIVESFLTFSHDYFIFDLREEREHLLHLHDYLDWYTSGAIPEDPRVLTDVVQEGITYSYNMVDPPGDFRVALPGSELVVSGIAMVRHMAELSMAVLCGETPPQPSDEAAEGFYDKAGSPMETAIEKEGLALAPEYTVEDRYLTEVSGYARVIALVRVDLASRQCSVRYLNQDIGPAYAVASDDPTMFPTAVTPSERDTNLAVMAKTLSRYEPLFASLWSLMYLPVFFIDRHGQVTETTFSTDLHTRRQSTEVRRAIRHLGRSAMTFSRTVHCFRSGEFGSSEDEMTITPPEMEHAESGFWKTLPPGEVGEDEDGRPILGKTWVERTEIWPASLTAADFVVRRQNRDVQGPKPGYVYVVRSGSQRLDVYKIGKTSRTPELRAAELTRPTGVPTPFEVLARWEVGDIDLLEKQAHNRLRAYRVSRKREFFRAPLSLITGEIEAVVRQHSVAR